MPLNLPPITPGEDVWGQQANDNLTYLDEKLGTKGDKGDKGDDSTVPGPAGPSNSLSVGTVSSGAASATITGAAPTQVLNLTLPVGPASTVPGPKGEPGGTDAATAEWVQDGPLTSAALSAKIAPAADSTQALMGKLLAEQSDAAILFVGDSTGNETTEWIYRLSQSLATEWPRWTVAYRLWNDGAGSYDSAVTIQTGTGARTLTIWNASVAGFGTYHWTGARAQEAIRALSPDLVAVSLGHNEQPLTPAAWHAAYVSLTESITSSLATSLVVIAQNPATADTNQQARREVYRRIASDRGYGFIDVCQAFLDTGDALGLTGDGVHPTTIGSALWAATVLKAFRIATDRPPRTQPPSSLLVAGDNLLRNGDFSDGTSFWTLTNCTSAVDATDFETSTSTVAAPTTFISTARKFTASAASARLQQSLPLGRVRGRWVTVAFRVRVPTGQASSVGRAAIVDSSGSTVTLSEANSQGAFRWLVCTRYIPANATSAYVMLYVDSAGTGGANLTVDRVTVNVGRYPLAAARSTPAVTSGGGGAAAPQLDHLSTVGNSPAMTMLASNYGDIGVGAAGQARLAQVVPHRDMTIARLFWLSRVAVGNYDICIKSSTGAILWSKGSTAMPAAGSIVETLSSPVTLIAGTKYYVGMSFDDSTARVRGLQGQGAEFARLMDGSNPYILQTGQMPFTGAAIGTSASPVVPIVVLAES